MRVNKDLLQVWPLVKPLPHKLDMRPQVKLFLFKRQKYVLKLAGARGHRLRKRPKLRPKRLKERERPPLRPAPPKKLLKNHRRDVPRQRERVHLPQRHKQPVVNLKLHRARNVHRKVHLVPQRLTPRPKPKPVKVAKLVQKKKKVVRVRRRRRRRATKLLLPHRLKPTPKLLPKPQQAVTRQAWPVRPVRAKDVPDKPPVKQRVVRLPQPRARLLLLRPNKLNKPF